MTPRVGASQPASPRRLLFVSPHFPPDSSAASHRARVLVPHLRKHGWDTVVLTVDSAAIEGRLDSDLVSSIPSHVRVVRAATASVRTARAAGIGDLGLRALRGLSDEGHRLLRTEPFDAVMITTYPIYPAWLGPRFKAAAGVPFVLDFQDPWVGAWGRTVGPGGRPDLRSRLSRRVAVTLEKTIVPQADALVAVSARTLEEVAARVPAVHNRPRVELPIGWEPADFLRATSARRPGEDVVFTYVGTLLPAGHDVVRGLLKGAETIAGGPQAPPYRLRFIGTSNQTKYGGPPLMSGLIPDGVRPAVEEQPQRVPYFDAIDTLCRSDVVLVLGTSEPHYTASKVYPALASRRPVLAILHEDSQAAAVLRRATGTVLVTFNGSATPSQLAERAGAAMRAALSLVGNAPFDRSDMLQAFSGEALASRLAPLLDSVVLRQHPEVTA